MDVLWRHHLLELLKGQNLRCLSFGVIFWDRSQLTSQADKVRVKALSYFVQVLSTNRVGPCLSHLHIKSHLGGLDIYGSLEFPLKTNKQSKHNPAWSWLP